jgi:tetratricopeptide (TPR) repeat protein
MTPEVRLATAHAAIGRGELVGARSLLAPLIDDAALGIDARHALAILERRLGRYEVARKHIAMVIEARPNDAYARNNLARCLRDAEDLEGAVEQYRRTLALEPAYLDALINLGLALQQLGRLDEALDSFTAAVRLAPQSGKAWYCMGLVQHDQFDLDAAAASLDRAVSLEPRNVQRLHARALIEAERGKEAAEFYARARATAPNDPDITLGEAVARFENGQGEDAIASLERLTEARPEWVEGHAALSQMRWQLGDTSGFAQSFDAAIERRPYDLDLTIGCFGTLMRAGRYADVLARLDAVRSRIDARDLFDRYQAVCASEVGDIETADRAFARQLASDDRGLAIAHVRHLLRAHRFHEAAYRAAMLASRADGAEAWPYLSIAWRLLGDPRASWLDRADRFVTFTDHDELAPRLERIAELLRATRHELIQPFDQPLRGSTQTQGHLFMRREPELADLRGIIEHSVAQYIEQLPPRDLNHPFLRERSGSARIVRSYSVRPGTRGFHVNRVQTDSWLSCVLYIDVPAGISADANDPAGWLAIGQPSADLGVQLPPLARVRPVPGRLAIFPSLMWHGTIPYSAADRLAVVAELVADP